MPQPIRNYVNQRIVPYQQAVSYVQASVRYVANQVTTAVSKVGNFVGTKAQQADYLAQQQLAVAKQVALETRAKAEARIRKLCENTKTAAKAVGNFVQKHESVIRTGLSITAGVLTIFPATTAIGVAMGAGLGAYSVANAVTGKNLITGKELSTGQRVLESVTGVLGMFPGATQAVQGTKVGARLSNTANQFVNGVNNVHNGGNLAVAGGGALSTVGSASNSVSGTLNAIGAGANTAESILMANSGNGDKPMQEHHYATNKSKTYTEDLEKITKKYDLDLDDAWNKEYLPHQGRHPNKYHDFIKKKLDDIDGIAQGDRDLFLELFEEEVKKKVRENPDMLYSNYWKMIGE